MAKRAIFSDFYLAINKIRNFLSIQCHGSESFAILFLDFTGSNIEVHGWVTPDFLTLIYLYACVIKVYTFILYLLRLIR